MLIVVSVPVALLLLLLLFRSFSSSSFSLDTFFVFFHRVAVVVLVSSSDTLTRASCRKDWKRISAESFLMSPTTTKSVKGLNLLLLFLCVPLPPLFLLNFSSWGDPTQWT